MINSAFFSFFVKRAFAACSARFSFTSGLTTNLGPRFLAVRASNSPCLRCCLHVARCIFRRSGRRFAAPMPDYYHSPALILMALLLPAFGYLYLRFRDARSLLWFLGFLCSIVAMVLLYTMNGYPGAGSPWLVASGQTFIQLSAAMFLGSLSPLRFRVGRFQILFVVPYAAFLV